MGGAGPGPVCVGPRGWAPGGKGVGPKEGRGQIMGTTGVGPRLVRPCVVGSGLRG